MGGTGGGTVIEVPDHVLVQRLSDDESVFLNLATEEYFGLDAVGTAMWDALVGSGTVDAALVRLEERFDVDSEVLARDLETLVAKLTERGLLRLGTDPS